MDELTFTLHHPLTDEEWDAIIDVDFEHTDEITFHTKNGKKVVFVKKPHCTEDYCEIEEESE